MLQDKLPDVPISTAVEHIVLGTTLLLLAQGLMQMRVASLCDGDAGAAFLVDSGIHDYGESKHEKRGEPGEFGGAQYPRDALKYDQFAMSITYVGRV